MALVVALVPAHNEEGSIGATIKALVNQTRVPDRLVLVTCNNKEASGTVVEAWLVSAEPLQAIDS